MENKRKLVTLGVILLLTYASVVTVYAAPPPPPTQGSVYDLVFDVLEYLTGDLTDAVADISDYLTDTLDPKIDDIAGNLSNVSTELGMETSQWFSYEEGYETVVTVTTYDLARFTVTVSFIQGDATDNATIYYQSYGSGWGELAFLQPGEGEETTFTATVVAKAIKIVAYNTNTDYPGVDPKESTVVWAISAVGTPDSESLTILP